MDESPKTRGPAGPPVRHRRYHRHVLSTTLKTGAVAVGVVLVSAIAVAGIGTLSVAQSFRSAVTLHHSSDAKIPQIGALTGGVNFLLVGDDSGGGDPKYGERGEKLNDVTILLHLYSGNRHAAIVSFPRDLHVRIPACGDHSAGRTKINVSFSRGGLTCTVSTVEDLTGLTISYAADVDFDGAAAIAGAIGGVTVCLASPIDDDRVNPPLHLPAGEVTLHGAEAVSFLRTRHGIGDGSDLGRVSNQQLFFSAMLRQTRSQLANVPRLYRIAKTVATNITPSQSLTNLTTLVQIALAFKDIDLSNVVFVEYPNHYVEGSNDVFPNEASADALTTALKADKPIELTGKTSRGGATELAPGATPAPTGPAGPTTVPTIPSDSGSAGGAVVLPDDVTGQNAAQKTCSVGYGG